MCTVGSDWELFNEFHLVFLVFHIIPCLHMNGLELALCLPRTLFTSPNREGWNTTRAISMPSGAPVSQALPVWIQ